MKICFAASECFPFVKTGGLGDVVGSLPKEISRMKTGGKKKVKNDVKIILPLYKGIKTLQYNIVCMEEFGDIPVAIGDKEIKFRIFTSKLPDTEIDVYFADCPEYFHRDMPYTNDPDEDERFILFQKAVIEILQRLKWAPDVIHCNDWQTGLIPVFLNTIYKWDKLFDNTSVLFSVHNIGYQGRFSEKSVFSAGLSYNDFYNCGPLELNGSFCFMKAGILYSEIISTVSKTYAMEIRTPEYGAGMESVLQIRKDDIYGVLNGIDTNIWNPKIDKFIPANYNAKDTSNKIICKKELLREAELVYDENVPVIGIISRFAGQKGFELLFPVINELMQLPLQLIVLGSGDEKSEKFFEQLAMSFPHKVNTYIGYNNKLAHYITAGSDMFLMPSIYEPCGLNQMYSLNYGTVPIVRNTGGLADTVIDFHKDELNGNGFSFDEQSPAALYTAILRAVEVFGDKNTWEKIMQRGMKIDFSWKHSAKEYMELYKKAVEKKSNNLI
ncbi:MAG TPA: glycogen synthase [Ignavibacteria bacterium]|nr:glycogen synthase [Bacteroidota bacterium]HRI85166.1 glycogen synthase [Ignavibacteria bacterium]HRJ99819.1 glycogen synthase [Ignavibacteria bacterium]